MPVLAADLSREWSTQVLATDASPSYGFGTSVCDLPRSMVAELGRKADTRGDFVRLQRPGGSDDEDERLRLGAPHRLPVPKRAFRDVLSLRARKPEHAGIMELKGVLLSLKWFLRSAKNQGQRLVMLIDAKASLSAVAKQNQCKRVLYNTLLHQRASASVEHVAATTRRSKRGQPSRRPKPGSPASASRQEGSQKGGEVHARQEIVSHIARFTASPIAVEQE